MSRYLNQLVLTGPSRNITELLGLENKALQLLDQIQLNCSNPIQLYLLFKNFVDKP